MAHQSLGEPHSSVSKWLQLIQRNLAGFHDLGNSIVHFREHAPKSIVEEQGILVVHQEMVELQINLLA
jgi:hypothetical protein